MLVIWGKESVNQATVSYEDSVDITFHLWLVDWLKRTWQINTSFQRHQQLTDTVHGMCYVVVGSD